MEGPMAEPHTIECILVLKRIYDAPLERIWRAWTEAEALGKWYMADDDHVIHFAEADVRVGGTYRVAFGRPGATPYIETGRYSEVTPMTRLAWIAEVALEGADTDYGELIELDLIDLGDGRTQLVLVSKGEQAWRSGAGWFPCLSSLARYLAA
jgi:uncharacterized protein YndB with AHSA1/START domain